MLEILSIAVASICLAGQPAAKSGYTLFNPTPRALMREMSTDRPDTTESAFTVDAGHVQVEMSLIDYTYNDDGGVTTRTFAAAPLLLKLGLTNNVDLQLGLDPYTRVSTHDDPDGSGDAVEGFGDTTLRLKVNLFGNDSTEQTGDWALAVMPFVAFPTARDGLGADHIEWGLIAAAALDLSDGWGLGLMIELDALSDDDGSGYVYDFVHTATVSRDFSDEVGAYVEYAGFLSLNDAEDYRAYADAGMTYALDGDTQFDVGVRLGLTDAADDFGVFMGVSLRF